MADTFITLAGAERGRFDADFSCRFSEVEATDEPGAADGFAGSGWTQKSYAQFCGSGLPLTRVRSGLYRFRNETI